MDCAVPYERTAIAFEAMAMVRASRSVGHIMPPAKACEQGRTRNASHCRACPPQRQHDTARAQPLGTLGDEAGCLSGHPRLVAEHNFGLVCTCVAEWPTRRTSAAARALRGSMPASRESAAGRNSARSWAGTSCSASEARSAANHRGEVSCSELRWREVKRSMPTGATRE